MAVEMTSACRIRRAYRAVSVRKARAGFAILLDDAPAQTPCGAALVVPTVALAEALAFEWSGAAEFVDFNATPLTRLAVAAIDCGSPAASSQWANDIIAFARSDLLCYRAPEPAALASRQSRAWDPYLQWARETLGAALVPTAGVAAIEQPGPAMSAISAHLADFGPWRLIGARRATELLGSAILALALAARAFPEGAIFDAARLDERFQSERWGIDAEAAAREAAIKREFDAIARWFLLLAEA
jgi:chaperone required for assembly of F1-ATPase